MREFQERNKAKGRMYSKVTLSVLVLILLLVAKGVFSVYQKERDTALEVDRVNRQKMELQARYAALQENSDNLKTPQGIESEIRTKFDVAKEGEGVIVVVDKDIPAIQPDTRGIIKKFWDSVTGIFKKAPSQAPADEKGTVVQKGQ